MFWRMLKRSFTRGLKGKLLAIVTIAFGASVAAAMLNLMLDVGDKINRELKSYGANLVVEPNLETLPLEIGGIDFDPLGKRAYLNEEDLPKVKTIFWSFNIVGFTPFLEASARLNGSDPPVPVSGTWFERSLTAPTGETVEAGLRPLRSWWQIDGEWVGDDQESPDAGAAAGIEMKPAGALVGAGLAEKLSLRIGDNVTLTLAASDGQRQVPVAIKGIIRNGGADEDRFFVPISVLQGALDLKGKFSRAEVSALTTPDNELARRAEKDPASLTTKEFETWYCTAYVSAIAYQIEEVIPGSRVKALRQVSESEGVILGKIQLLMLLLTAAALLSSALGISSLMTTKVLERSREIGLMKAIGAYDYAVATLFIVESGLTGVLGGLLGYGAGALLAGAIGRSVFGSSVEIKVLVAPIVLILAIGVALIGSLSAVRMITRLRPAEVLHGR